MSAQPKNQSSSSLAALAALLTAVKANPPVVESVVSGVGKYAERENAPLGAPLLTGAMKAGNNTAESLKSLSEGADLIAKKRNPDAIKAEGAVLFAYWQTSVLLRQEVRATVLKLAAAGAFPSDLWLLGSNLSGYGDGTRAPVAGSQAASWRRFVNEAFHSAGIRQRVTKTKVSNEDVKKVAVPAASVVTGGKITAVCLPESTVVDHEKLATSVRDLAASPNSVTLMSFLSTLLGESAAVDVVVDVCIKDNRIEKGIAEKVAAP